MNNFINLKDRTPQERQEIAKKGGIARGQQLHNEKLLRDVKTILTSKIPQKLQNQLTEQLQLPIKKNLNYQECISLALVYNAIKGNVRAYEIIRDTIGEKPIEQKEIKEITPVVIIDDVTE